MHRLPSFPQYFTFIESYALCNPTAYNYTSAISTFSLSIKIPALPINELCKGCVNPPHGGAGGAGCTCLTTSSPAAIETVAHTFQCCKKKPKSHGHITLFLKILFL